MTGYFIDSISNQPIYRCLSCRYDSFSLSSITDHCRYNHAQWQLPECDLPLREWSDWRRNDNSLTGKKIAIGFLTWNSQEPSRLAARAIAEEADRLEGFGVETTVIWVDNGSEDGTVRAVKEEFTDKNVNLRLLSRNWGQSLARNYILVSALDWKCDYLTMVDGDVGVIPYSVYAMADYLERADATVGCIGMYCRNCTHLDNDGAAEDCRRIDDFMIDKDPPIAWTNYGVFRRSVLEQVHFDVASPFQGPGWGFEDDDFYLSMVAAGFSSVNTKYFRHMHRRRHSSLKALDPDLAAKVYQSRKQYLLSKWAGVEAVADRIRVIENQGMPTLEY